MAVPSGAYSDTVDLLHGDIPLPQRHGDGAGMVTAAAEDIDSQIGHIYVTPIQVNPDPKNRPTRLLLKKINNYIASGRLLLDMAAAGEDNDLHAYGRSLLTQGLELLAKIAEQEITLTGCETIAGDVQQKPPSKLFIINQDPESLVEGFYRRTNGRGETFKQGVLPYGEASA